MSDRGLLAQTLLEYGEAFVDVGKRDDLADTRFSDRESHILRICSMSSSSSSLVSGLVALYMFGAIDYKKRVFRHQLIIFLIIFDLIKAGVLLIYPARIQTKYLAYYNHNFCEIVGFFTSLAIEGADIAILSFAVHTGLLIFRPNIKVKNGTNLEGGLFRYRYYVYLISFLTPCVLASLAFVNGTGYKPLTTWCYLPQSPRWYRLVLSWVPRYLIVITIVTIYVSIYYYVMRQYSIVGGNFQDIHKTSEDSSSKTTWQRAWKTFKKYYINFKRIVMAILFPEMTMYPFFDEEEPEDNTGPKQEQASSKVKRIKMADLDENGNIIGESTDPEAGPSSEASKSAKQDKFKEKLHRETYHQFQIRRLQIQKQMKSIFIYPISYIFLWSFPFILQCFEFNNADSNIIWLNAVAAFFQPFNCTVDTLVFLYRERPWTITTANTDTNPLEVYQYPRWKRALSWFPLYGLPTLESNQANYYNAVQKKIENQKLRSASNSSESSPGDENKHDFSAILSGPEIDFVKIPPTAAAASKTSRSSVLKAFNFSGNEANVSPPSRHGSSVDPTDLSPQQFDSQRRRRSSKLSWLSSISAGDGRRSSGNISMQTTQTHQPRGSINDISDSSISPTAQLFSQSYNFDNSSVPTSTAIPAPASNVVAAGATNLPEISEQPSASSRSLKPQQSPTSPTSPTTRVLEPSRMSSSNSVSAQSDSHDSTHALHSAHHLRNFSNAFGLTRRPSFFDTNHTDVKKKSPFSDDHKAFSSFDGSTADKAVGVDPNEEDDDDLDFLDFLKRGPPA